MKDLFVVSEEASKDKIYALDASRIQMKPSELVDLKLELNGHTVKVKARFTKPELEKAEV